jgi:hypothetical protein
MPVRYALLVYRAPGAAAPGDRPTEADGRAGDGVFDDWVAYTRAVKRAGVLVGAEQLQVVDTATSVRLRSGERLLTDGPFIETKEHLLGFYLVEVSDLDAAIDWAARMPAVRYGTVEVRFSPRARWPTTPRCTPPTPTCSTARAIRPRRPPGHAPARRPGTRPSVPSCGAGWRTGPAPTARKVPGSCRFRGRPRIGTVSRTVPRRRAGAAGPVLGSGDMTLTEPVASRRRSTLLVAARAVQGVGAAIVMPLSLTILTAAVPARRRGAIIGIWGGIAGIAVASGPLIGGAVIQGLDWHWIFWVNVPIGLVATVLSVRRLAESRGPAARLDLPAVGLIAGGATGIVWALARVNEVGRGGLETAAALGLGVLFLAVRPREPVAAAAPAGRGGPAESGRER